MSTNGRQTNWWTTTVTGRLYTGITCRCLYVSRWNESMQCSELLVGWFVKVCISVPSWRLYEHSRYIRPRRVHVVYPQACTAVCSWIISQCSRLIVTVFCSQQLRRYTHNRLKLLCRRRVRRSLLSVSARGGAGRMIRTDPGETRGQNPPRPS